MLMIMLLSGKFPLLWWLSVKSVTISINTRYMHNSLISIVCWVFACLFVIAKKCYFKVCPISHDIALPEQKALQLQLLTFEYFGKQNTLIFMSRWTKKNNIHTRQYLLFFHLELQNRFHFRLKTLIIQI